MINILPEPKLLRESGGFTAPISGFRVCDEEARELLTMLGAPFAND